MIRVVLVLAVVILLILSADVGHTQLQQVPFDPRAAVHLSTSLGQGAALQAEASSIQASMLEPIQPALTVSAGEEAPAPALLVYLVLIVLGSVVSVVLVHQQQRRQA